MIAAALLLLSAPAPAVVLRAPRMLTDADVEVPVSAPLRAETLRGLPPPAEPITFRFQCTINPRFRTLNACMDLPEGAAPAATLPMLVAAGEQASGPAFAWRQAALDRVRLIRLRANGPLLSPANEAGVPTVVVSEVVAAADSDVPAADSGAAPLAPVDLVYDAPPTLSLTQSYYPPVALRSGTRARLMARCLVQPDRRLFCRDPHLDPADQYMVPAERRAFELTTVQLASAFRLAERGRDGSTVVGRPVDLGVVWALP